MRRDIVTGIVGGKADEFPLWDESKRAWKPTDNCDDEQPLIIDPCNLADVALITFAENGEAAERYGKDSKPILYEKAHKSILLYHLNHSDFIRERIKLRDEIEENIKDAKRYYRKLGTDEADANDDYAYMRAIEQLRNARREEAQFSSFAIVPFQPYSLDESLAPVFVSG